jgi:hypothetical protein
VKGYLEEGIPTGSTQSPRQSIGIIDKGGYSIELIPSRRLIVQIDPAVEIPGHKQPEPASLLSIQLELKQI